MTAASRPLDVICLGRAAVDLYGQQVEVALHHYLRPEAKFDNIDELVAQIGRDAAQTKELLA